MIKIFLANETDLKINQKILKHIVEEHFLDYESDENKCVYLLKKYIYNASFYQKIAINLDIIEGFNTVGITIENQDEPIKHFKKIK